MLKTSLIQKYKAILDAIEGFPGGAGVDLIEKNMPFSIPRRTLQRHLGKLVEEGRLEKKGQGRAIRYLFTKEKFQETQSAPPLTKNTHAAFLIPLSDEATLIENHINQPLQKRIPVGYNQEFLDSYRPGVSFYLPESLRAELLNHGQAVNANKPAGTYARRIATRLLIDLSWNSSRLEGNT
ncbi:MAG: hypothetical protein PHO79_01135, partial [Desulfoplanes sp.]|nr:hypothetical protein [Desulfoplanes sp.]